jgi:3-oxoacyl-[acyl-carrier-protein] synthase III
VTALAAVAAYLPARAVPIASVREQLGLSVAEVKVFQRYYGLELVRRDDGTLLDLMLAAAGRLGELSGRERRVRYVLQARTNPVVVPYPVNPLAEACRRLGLEHAVAFAVTQHACASGLLAIDIAGRLLAATGDPDALALVFTGEKTFTRGAQVIPRQTVMSEGAAACLVRYGGDRDRVRSYASAMYGQYDRLQPGTEVAAEFQERYPHLLAEVILAAVAKAGIALEDLRLVLPHNVNAVSWERISRILGLPVERVLLDNVPLTGHCFCADGFINYRTAVDTGRLSPGDRYLMAAVGLGATFSAMVFEH